MALESLGGKNSDCRPNYLYLLHDNQNDSLIIQEKTRQLKFFTLQQYFVMVPTIKLCPMLPMLAFLDTYNEISSKKVIMHLGYTISQAVARRLLTAEARVCSQDSLCVDLW